MEEFWLEIKKATTKIAIASILKNFLVKNVDFVLSGSVFEKCCVDSIML